MPLFDNPRSRSFVFDSVTKLKVSSDGRESAGSFDIVGRKLNGGGMGERFHGLERTNERR